MSLKFEEWVDRQLPDGATPLTPAATVILLRDGAAGLETLMMKKNSKITFGGMWVFPGGKIDPEDYPADNPGDQEAASITASVREAQEESSLIIDPESLVPYSHWIPPAQAPKRFSTWFYIAPAPAGEVTIDDGEIKEHAWWRPGHVLEQRDAGDVELAPLTFVTLTELANTPTVADALSMARTREKQLYATRIRKGSGGMVVTWEPDAAHESGDLDADGPRHRLTMADDKWSYVQP